MDIFTQKRYLFFIIILLVILNLATLLMLWFGHPGAARPDAPPHSPRQAQARMEKLLKEELGFDAAQTSAYFHLQRQHREKIRKLEMEIRQIKKQMFDEVLAENPKPTLSDSLLKLAQGKQAQIEKLTFQHFLDLKKMCKADQQKKLKLLMHELFHRAPAGKAKSPPPSGIHPPKRHQN